MRKNSRTQAAFVVAILSLGMVGVAKMGAVKGGIAIAAWGLLGSIALAILGVILSLSAMTYENESRRWCIVALSINAVILLAYAYIAFSG